MAKPHQIEIHNIGPISDLKIEIREGVNILRGRNGAGKTTAIKAVRRALGGAGSLPLSDGAHSGSVVADGVTIKVRKATTATGTPSVSLAPLDAISRLIDPQIKDSEKANDARLRALAEITSLEVDQALIERMVPHPEVAAAVADRVRALRSASVLDIREVARREFHALARECESLAEKCRSAGEQSAASVQHVEDPGIDPVTALDAATLAEVQARATEEERRRALNIRAEIDRIQVSDTTEADHEAAKALVQSAGHEMDATGRAVEAAHAICKEKWHAATVAERAASKRMEEADRRKSLIANAVKGPSDDDVFAANASASAARSKAMQAKVYEDDQRARARVAQYAEQEKAHTESALALRASADRVDSAMNEILADHTGGSLSIVDGRLCAVIDGKAIDMTDRASEGERVAAVLRLAIKAYGSLVIALDGSYWSALDPARKAEIAGIAKDLGCYVVTEEPADIDGIEVAQ